MPWPASRRLMSLELSWAKRRGLTVVDELYRSDVLADRAFLRGHERQPQRLLRREVHAPSLMAGGTLALHARVMPAQHCLPPNRVAAQTDRAGQRSNHQGVGVVGPEPGGVCEDGHLTSMSQRTPVGNPRVEVVLLRQKVEQ
jgi:hypothetical protein